jgi:2-C-methyl-D-erythritol 2,4-cyclodiphosphate synthase
MRIGHGYDVHKFAENRPLIMGGETIAHSHGLGAAGLWDIGHHFPDTDDSFKNIDSRILLARVVNDLAEHGWKVGNIDSTIIAQAPKMAPYIPAMKANLAHDLNINLDAVNVKATTTENLGFAGRKEGIAAHAVVIIVKAD